MGKFRVVAGTVLVGTMMLVVAACSDDETGGTFPGSSSSPSLPSASGHSAANGDPAPKVTTPLQPAGLVGRPCESLTADQLDDLGVQGEGEEINLTADGVKGCDWKFGANLEWKIQAAYVTPDAKNGLQNEYDQKAAGWFDSGYFEPTSVSGYPGVYSNVSDTRPNGRCDLGVGINDETLLTVAITGEASKDNCKAASNVAARIISTIQAGGH